MTPTEEPSPVKTAIMERLDRMLLLRSHCISKTGDFSAVIIIIRATLTTSVKDVNGVCSISYQGETARVPHAS